MTLELNTQHVTLYIVHTSDKHISLLYLVIMIKMLEVVEVVRGFMRLNAVFVNVISKPLTLIRTLYKVHKCTKLFF